MAKITIKRFRYPGAAECEGCDKLHPDSTRERCRVHAQTTGHKVRFLIEDVTTYELGEAAPVAATKEDR
jgi:hypothetical protein